MVPALREAVVGGHRVGWHTQSALAVLVHGTFSSHTGHYKCYDCFLPKAQ